MGICPVCQWASALVTMGKPVGNLPHMAGEWRKRLEDELAAQGREMKEVSLSAGLGETYIRDALKRGRGGKVENLEKIAVALGRDPDFLTRNGPALATVDGKRVQPNARDPRPIEPDYSREMIPVYGSAMGGSDGRFQLNGQIVDMVAAPPGLRGTKDAYAVYVVGSSMEHRYYEGETVYVHPGKPPRPGDFVVVQLKPRVDGDDYEGVVKKLVSRTPSKIVVEQFNPPMRIEFAADEVRALHKIVLGGE